VCAARLNSYVLHQLTALMLWDGRPCGRPGPGSFHRLKLQAARSADCQCIWLQRQCCRLRVCGSVDACPVLWCQTDQHVYVPCLHLSPRFAVWCCVYRALQVCEQKPLYLALLGILERSGRSKLAGEVWRTATKKFNTSCKVRQRRHTCSASASCPCWLHWSVSLAVDSSVSVCIAALATLALTQSCRNMLRCASASG
jgi:hypothetical protein